MKPIGSIIDSIDLDEIVVSETRLLNLYHDAFVPNKITIKRISPRYDQPVFGKIDERMPMKRRCVIRLKPNIKHCFLHTNHIMKSYDWNQTDSKYYRPYSQHLK